MLAHLLSNHPYTLCSATDTRLSIEMSSHGNNDPKHVEIEITIYDDPSDAKGADTEENTDTLIRETLRACIQVDKDGNFVHVCDGDQYHKFFQAYLWGPEFQYRLDVKDVSVPLSFFTDFSHQWSTYVRMHLR